jgi:preprotein translocase subunit SecA
MSILDTIFGDHNKKTLGSFSSTVSKINSLEADFANFSKEDFRQKTLDFKKKIKGGTSLDEILPEAYAMVREASKRTLGQRHFDVQMLGGIAIHKNHIAEMRTGEGKTLVATLPVYLNALQGEGVHVVTVNDYLSRRDAVWMGQIYDYLGLTVGVIGSQVSYLYDPLATNADKERDDVGSFHIVHEFLRASRRREAYAADITYGTNSEFGFDYLRDNIALSEGELVQRGHYFAIVDEIDSILIDEARTPLIISGISGDAEDLYVTFARLARSFEQSVDFEVDEKKHAVTVTDSGIEKAEKALGIDNIYTDKDVSLVHHLENAVKAKALYKKDKEYVIKEGEVIIVDEFTGRLQPGRRWSSGLHQAIEAKEGVPIQKESKTLASVTYQNYFRMYKKLSGMTGTAKTSAEEFRKVYGLDVIEIPTNVPTRRRDQDDLIFQSERGKFKAIAREIKERSRLGQPVLVGTVSVENNEMLSQFLRSEGVTHEILNAKNHEREGEIIAQAGRKGNVTIATNMAGRGVDIKLGGNPSTMDEYEEVKSLGGLYVLGTERHDARRIDNQLRGRSGRQGDPGETQFFVSMEDSLMRIFASDAVKGMMGRMGLAEDEPIKHKMISKSLESAQQKVENANFDVRKHVLQYDEVLNHQRTIIYSRRRQIVVGGPEAVDKYLENLSLGDGEFAKLAENLKAKLGAEEFYAVMRRLILQSTDSLWVEHLEGMDYLKGSVNLRAYGQRDPLVEYKKEGLRMFKDMEGMIGQQIKEIVPNLSAGAFLREEEKLRREHSTLGLSVSGGTTATVQGSGPVSPDGDKVGRNDPCPCGAINPETNEVYKYKKCGLINAPYHKG